MFVEAAPEDPAREDMTSYYTGQRDNWGFLPNYAAAFSFRPEVGHAWNTLNLTVREGMERRRFEIATIAAARALRSTYCTVAHSSFLLQVCQDEETLRLIDQDPTGAALEPVDRAVYEFAAKVAVDAAGVSQADIDRLRAAGLSDGDIADVVYAVAARAFFTRIVDGLGTELDPPIARRVPSSLLPSMQVGRATLDVPPGS